jgi:hypothetical protein
MRRSKELTTCKFCGCSDLNPCAIPITVVDDAAVLSSALLAEEFMACAWLLPDVCTAPECVEKAYAEARPLAEAA